MRESKYKLMFSKIRQAKSGFTLYLRRRQAESKGFTLIELIIYMGLVSILIVVFMDILSASFNSQLSSQSTSEVVQDGRYIYARLTYDLNRADSVSIPANLGDSSSTLTVTINGNNLTYGINGGNFEITTTSGLYVLNSVDTSVSNLQFQRIGNTNGKHTVRIAYTITGKINLSGRYDMKSFQTTAGLR